LTGSTVTIRSGAISDIPSVVALWHRAAGPTRHPGGRTEAEQLLQRDPGALVVAEDDGTIVGTLIVGWDGWRCHLYRLAVEPEVRRTGIAALLVAEARRRAHDHHAARIDAMVNVENETAVAFWESVGFAFDGNDGRWSAPT
jgi:ribosomal protein S18 acetylase RimI-like enzyme